jgi:hypothetical protein
LIVTNEVDARSVPVYGGHRGEFRKVHRSEWEPVQVNGIPQIYGTALEAENAAWRALRSHLCADIVGSGEKASAAAKSRGEALFGVIFKKGKKISVSRK